MTRFVEGYTKKLKALGLENSVALLKIYVDDLNQAGYCLPYGSSYHNGRLYMPGLGWRGRSPPGFKMDQDTKLRIEQEANLKAQTGSTQEQREKDSAAVYRQVLPRSV